MANATAASVTTPNPVNRMTSCMATETIACQGAGVRARRGPERLRPCAREPADAACARARLRARPSP
jgi:hypothetical protein